VSLLSQMLRPWAMTLARGQFLIEPNKRRVRDERDVLLTLLQRRNIGKHFGWFSLLAY
jgi:hypothetical protein